MLCVWRWVCFRPRKDGKSHRSARAADDVSVLTLCRPSQTRGQLQHWCRHCRCYRPICRSWICKYAFALIHFQCQLPSLFVSLLMTCWFVLSFSKLACRSRSFLIAMLINHILQIQHSSQYFLLLSGYFCCVPSMVSRWQEIRISLVINYRQPKLLHSVIFWNGRL
jgi:hypothetical protein